MNKQQLVDSEMTLFNTTFPISLPVDTYVPTLDSNTSDTIQTTQPLLQHEHNNLDSPVPVDTELGDLIFIDQVTSVGDIDVRNGVPGFDLEMASGDPPWTPLRIRRPSEGPGRHSHCELSVDEMQEFDEIIFQGRDEDYAPGVILVKGSTSVWTLIASRTRLQLKSK